MAFLLNILEKQFQRQNLIFLEVDVRRRQNRGRNEVENKAFTIVNNVFQFYS